MEPNDGKLSSGPIEPSIEETYATNGSHEMTLNPIPGLLENPKDLVESISTEYHLTATVSNSQLGQRELSLLLEVLNYQIVTWGANFSMMLALSELFLRVTKGQDVDLISNSKIRLTAMVSEILIGSLRGQDFSLYSGEYITVSHTIKSLLRPYLLSKRTYNSRFRTWRPEKFIRVRAVPVSTLIERAQSSSKRYSSYTKGYGESHPSAHRQHTKPSMELDGDPNGPDKVERNLILRMTDVGHQIANILWIKFQNLLAEK